MNPNQIRNIESDLRARSNGADYRCLSDTAYSPTDYAAAWEVADV